MVSTLCPGRRSRNERRRQGNRGTRKTWIRGCDGRAQGTPIEADRRGVSGTPVSSGKGDKWLFPEATARPFLRSPFTSFPSGHANGAFVIAAFLRALYPRGRLVWLLIAAEAALARVRSRHHYVEDIMFGGGLGWITARWVFSRAGPARVLQWLQKHTGMIAYRQRRLFHQGPGQN